jgi:hypothetical protein
MKIERKFTVAGQDAYLGIDFRKATSEIKNPDGSAVFQQKDIEVPAQWSQVACDIIAQKYFRRKGVPVALKSVQEESVPNWLWRKEADKTALDRRSALCGRNRCPPSVRPPRRHLDLLGLEGRLFRFRSRRPRLLRRAALHAGRADGGAELAAVVQHRPALGLWHRRPRPGPLLCRSQDRQADQVGFGLRASAAACLLHPVGARTISSTKAASWTCGCARRACSNTARAPARTSPPARRRRKAVRRRQVLRPDELPQDRRPRRRRHQVGRHHAPRRQDGGRRRRPSGYRGLHRLEGDRGAEGRRARHRLQDLRQEAPEGGHEGLRQLRRLDGDDCFDPRRTRR